MSFETRTFSMAKPILTAETQPERGYINQPQRRRGKEGYIGKSAEESGQLAPITTRYGTRGRNRAGRIAGTGHHDSGCNRRRLGDASCSRAGILEGVYEQAFALEMELLGIAFER